MNALESLNNILKDTPAALEWYTHLYNQIETRVHIFQLIGACKIVQFKDSLNHFLRCLDSYLLSLNDWENVEPSDVFHAVRQRSCLCMLGTPLLASGVHEDEDCCFSVQAQNGEEFVPNIGCAIRLSSFFEFYRPPDAAISYRDHLEFAKDAEEKIVAPSGTMKTGAGFQWVTEYDSIPSKVDYSSTVDQWQRTREVLGLNLNESLVIVEYPADFNPSLCCVPTLIEGGTQPYFFPYMVDHEDYNYTVDLRKLARGLREVVHCPYELNENFNYCLLDITTEDLRKYTIPHHTDSSFLNYVSDLALDGEAD